MAVEFPRVLDRPTRFNGPLLAGAISHVLFIIEDLDNCSGRSWQVSRAPFARVRDQIAASGGQAAPK